MGIWDRIGIGRPTRAAASPSIVLAQPAPRPLSPRAEDSAPDDAEKKDEGMEDGGEDDARCAMCGGTMKNGTCADCGYAQPSNESDGSSPPGEDEDEQEKEPDMADKTETAPKAATAAELDKEFGSDPAFCFQCSKDGLTLLQAHQKWNAKLQEQLAAAGKKNAGAEKLGGKPEQGLDRPLAPSNRAPAGAAQPARRPAAASMATSPADFQAYEDYHAAIKARLLTQPGMTVSRAESLAHMEATRTAPQLHNEWKSRRQGEAIKARAARDLATTNR